MRDLLLAFFSLGSLASAQATWIVDASGAGQFTDIQPAIQVAAPGDRVEVRAGSYGVFTLTKGLDIIAVSSPAVVPRAILRSLPAGQEAVLDGLRVVDQNRTTPGIGLELSGNVGSILLRSIQVVGSAIPGSSDPAVAIAACASVRCVDCSFAAGVSATGAHGLTIDGSTVHLLGTDVLGGAAFFNSVVGASGLQVNASMLAIAASLIVGGKGGPSVSTLGSSCWTLGPGGPGGAAVAGTGRVTVSAGSELRGGAGGDPNPIALNCAGTQGPAVRFTGRLDASADTVLQGAASSGVTGIPFQPILDMQRHVNRGGVASAPLTTRPSAAAWLYVDPAPGGILYIPGLDAPFVLSGSALPILTITTSVAGTGTFQIPLPVDPVFRELDLSFQVVTAAAALPQFRLSNLGVLRVH